MATSLDQTRRAVETYSSALEKITLALLRVLLALWKSYPDDEWGNIDFRRAWAAKSAVHADVALAQARRVTRAYMLTQLGQLDATPTQVPDVLESYERGGVPIVEVYERPARQRDYQKRVEKKPPDEIVKAFEERLATIVRDDVMLTARDEALRVARASRKVVGYRRVLHPEFSETGPCGLCTVAADRLYKVDELMPIHDNCKCTVSPVTATQDLGLRLNREDLEAIYDAAGGTDAKKLSQLRIKTVQHGELGPMLLRSGGKWVDPATVNRRATRKGSRATPYKRGTVESTRANWKALKATSERSIRYLLNAKSRGSDMVDMGGGPTRVKDIDHAIQYHRDLIARAVRHGA